MLETVLSQLYFSAFTFLGISSEGNFKQRLDKEMQLWATKQSLISSPHRMLRQ